MADDHYSSQRTKIKMNPQVLYIHPSKQGMDFVADPSFGRPYGVIPVGAAGLVNCLRDAGISVRGMVHPLELQLDSRFSLKNWLLTNRSAQIVLIDMHWYEHCFGAVDTAEFVKKILPETKMILGGLSASGFADEIMKFTPAVDFIVRGDAEHPLLLLVERLLEKTVTRFDEIPNLTYRDDAGEVKHNPLGYTATTADIDRLDFTDIDFLDHAHEYHVHEFIVTDLAEARRMLNESTPNLGKWITTARGCKFNCSYCGGSRTAHKLLASRRSIIPRSPERVLDDLESLVRQNVIQASMSYDLAEMGEDYWRVVFEGMKKRRIKIGIYNEFFQMPSNVFIEELAGVADMRYSPVAISPLAGNERVRRLNGKHYTNEALFDMLDTLASHDFYLFIYFSLNLPGETEETFEQTLELAKSVYEFYPLSKLKILNTVHTIDPLSPMNAAPDKFGIVSSMRTFEDYYLYCKNTGKPDPESKTGYLRGFVQAGDEPVSLKRLADAWDKARIGRERSWWPIPPGW